MSKLKSAMCVNCGKRLGRHDKDRLVLEVPSQNPGGVKVTTHRKEIKK